MKAVLILICLTLWLSGCASPKVIVTTQVIPELPPLVLIESTDRPEFIGKTYGDVVRFVPELFTALDQCNADKVALQQWRDQRRAKPPF